MLYELALFVHMLGLIALFGALVMAQRGVRIADARRMLPSGAAMLAVSGAAMVAIGWRAATPWIVCGAAALVAAVPFGMAGLRDPPRRVPLSVANGLALATVLLMTVKPGWGASLGIVAVGAAGGALLARAWEARGRNARTSSGRA